MMIFFWDEPLAGQALWAAEVFDERRRRERGHAPEAARAGVAPAKRQLVVRLLALSGGRMSGGLTPWLPPKSFAPGLLKLFEPGLFVLKLVPLTGCTLGVAEGCGS